MNLTRSLSGRLLLLTVAIVMVAQVMVYLASIAQVRRDFLLERLQMAQIASLALLAADNEMVEEALEAELLANAEVSSIVLRRDSVRQLVLSAPQGARVADTYDLRQSGWPSLTVDAMAALWRAEPRMIRVIGRPVLEAGQVIEITLAEGAVRRALVAFSLNFLLISLAISAVTGVVIFVVSRRLLVRPIEIVVADMVAFQKDPENAPIAGRDRAEVTEIARAETALAEMQEQVRGALRQKTRLAELGVAVAKISHDLRNMLSVAQLAADRLEGSKDPMVARVGPKLIASIDRAVALCLSTLAHGKAEEAPPDPRRVALSALIEEVGEAVFSEGDGVRLINEVGEDVVALADPDHLFRILVNLTRNARQAMESSGRGDAVTVKAKPADGRVLLSVADNGPGMPEKALEHLFQPFKGGVAKGGAGLGLAIAAELAEANGGALSLVESTTRGTSFSLDLPGA